MKDKRLDIVLPIDQAQRIIDSPSQLIKILDGKGEWTGVTINKAEIKGTDRDWDFERTHNQSLELPEPEKPFNPVKNIEQYMPDFIREAKGLK